MATVNGTKRQSSVVLDTATIGEVWGFKPRGFPPMDPRRVEERRFFSNTGDEHLSSRRTLRRVKPSQDCFLVAAIAGQHRFALRERITAKPIIEHAVARWFELSPCGRFALADTNDGANIVYDTTIGATADKLPITELPRLWREMASPDAVTARRAIWKCVAQGKHVVNFIESRIEIPRVNAERFRTLIEDLDSPNFRKRQRAEQELSLIACFIVADLETAANDGSSPEAQLRAKRLLKTAHGTDRTKDGNVVRTVRAIEALMRIGSPKSRKIIKRVADGPPSAVETIAARGALEHWAESRSNK